MTSRFAEIINPYHRRGNYFPSAASDGIDDGRLAAVSGPRR